MTKKKTKRAMLHLNARERAIVTVLRKMNEPASLDEISTAAFLGDKRTGPRAPSYFRANSWARNAVRRPMRTGIVRRVGASGSGRYAITAKGREVAL